ncbi:MAG: hypothetical protein KKE93_03330 [Nanoarchaeota archaeon]|nr:hypothetical protein [Nanoarchaeota archaeon]
MVDMYKKIKTKVKTGVCIVGSGFLTAALLYTGALAQEGTIDNKLNEEISKPTNISLEKEEEQGYKDISDKIEESFRVDNCLCSRIESTNYYDVEGKENLYMGYFIECNKQPNFLSTINKAITEDKLKEVVSALSYTWDDVYFFNKSIRKIDNNTYFVLLKTNKKMQEKKFEIEMPVENEKN